MSDTNEHLDQTNKLLQKLIAIQGDIQSRQVQLLALHNRALLFGVIAFVTILVSTTSML